MEIYNGYAFTSNETEKRKSNRAAYESLNEKYRIYRNDIRYTPDVNHDDYDVIIGRQPKYKHADYNIIKNSPNLSTDELLLLCDNGNLCFGGRALSSTKMTVSED